MTRTPKIAGAPAREHRRSQAAWRVAELAEASHIMLSHFEQRVRLPAPPAWLPANRAGAENDVEWSQGVLKEPKYLVFRHDAMVGSFHPRHRAKWTAHELCHRLVGYGYKPGASSLWHTLAAWSAELLPVALWYFFDEAGLRRCERHQGSGPLFAAHCDACDQVALGGERKHDAEDVEWIERGVLYVEREIEAIERSAEAGKPIGTRHASIHLASDALGYVGSHRARLLAPQMERFVGSFVGEKQGCHSSLEGLIARVRAVCAAIVHGTALESWHASRWDWIAQDVGYRLLTVQAQLEKGHAGALDVIIDGLSKGGGKASVTRAIDDYATLAREQRGSKRSRLPNVETMFAVGYDLPREMGRSCAQVMNGIVSALPATSEALGKSLGEHTRSFVALDVPVRRGIGDRFAEYLSRVPKLRAVSDLARVEAAIVHAPSVDSFAANLDPFEHASDAALMLSPSASIVRIDHDVLDAEAPHVMRAKKLRGGRFLIVSRNASGSVDLLDVPEATADALSRRRGVPRSKLGVPDESLETLLRSGAVVPTRYEL